jgi:E1A/CREB-binding protein
MPTPSRFLYQVRYMDLDTLEARVDALLSSVSYRNHRDSWVSSAAASAKNLHQLPGIQMTDSSVYHDVVAPGFTNLPACATDVPTHTVFTSQSKLG